MEYVAPRVRWFLFLIQGVTLFIPMSKRFIDTGLFDDDWFMDLPKDAKLLWVYFITKCDHAGILKLNEKLCRVQTDIKDLDTVIKQLGNRLVTVSEHLYFIPKYIDFQYPGFPNSKVRQQQSAVDILIKHGLFDKEKLTLNIQLDNCYEHEHVNDTVNEHENGAAKNIVFSVFWDLYDKKVGSKDKCEKKWNKLSDQERQKIIDTLPAFLNSIKDKQFQPYPETYLNGKRWNDEIAGIVIPVKTERVYREGDLVPNPDHVDYRHLPNSIRQY